MCLYFYSIEQLFVISHENVTVVSKRGVAKRSEECMQGTNVTSRSSYDSYKKIFKIGAELRR